MERLVYSLVVIGMFGLMALGLSSCEKMEREMCHDRGMLYCSDKEGGCCPKEAPWSNGHGSCFNTLSYCRETGYECTKCY